MMARIFIDRPVFAWVVAIIIMLAGIVSLRGLAVEQYPDIAPPTINVRATYPGATAEILEDSVTQIIEQQLTGIEGLLYFSSNSSSDGQVSIQVTFERGVDPDIAQVQVQNRVQQALPRLPQQVQQQGLRVAQAGTDFLMVVSVYDETNRATNIDVADYLVSTLQDRLGRVPGVGDVNVFGSQYAMRIWLDPYKLAAVQLMPGDVIAAIEAQNTEVAAGQIGSQPAPPGQMLNAIVTARARFTTPEQFEQIIVKTQLDGSRVRLADVARVELGAESYNVVSRLNTHPAAGIAIQLAPGADALRTSELVRAEVEAQARDFPSGYRYAYPNDTSEFIRLSVNEVIVTMFVAIGLVIAVIFVFLQDWRATFIPAIAVPVALLGTFAAMAMAGFSINTLTLFGLILAIGLLTDDAIVVVENVERIMAEDPDISPRDATVKTMKEVQVALIATSLVLVAVFGPMALFGGSAGVIYRQFSVTMIASMILSVVVALTLVAALAAALLKQQGERKERAERAHGGRLGRFWRLLRRARDGFNRRFDALGDRYGRGVEAVGRRPRLTLAVWAGLFALLAFLFVTLPTGFLPGEDQGRISFQYTLPPGATEERTLAVAEQIERYFAEQEGANATVLYTISGSGPGGAAQNAGRGFISLAPWDARSGSENAAEAIVARATRALSSIRDADVFVLNPPPVRGLGQASGFTMQLLNNSGLSQAEFTRRRDELIERANADPLLTAVRFNGLEDVATLSVDIDQAAVGALGVEQADVDLTLATAWGGRYVNDFIDRGRVKRVFVQGDADYRARPEDLGRWFVRSQEGGGMAPFSAFARTGWGEAPVTLSRFNGVSAFEIEGDAGEGESSGTAMERIAELAREVGGVGVDWSGLSYQEREASGQAPLLYGLSLLIVFLLLAALYESWSIPFAVMLAVPVGVIGAVAAVALRGLEADIYFQVGLLTTMGLVARNAILIVEFAQAAQRDGKSAREAAADAARTRFRAILMTSLSFIAGLMPLAVATGAGAASRVAIGTAVVGGMLSAMALAIFFVPFFYVLVRGGWRELVPSRWRRDGDGGAETQPDGREATA